MNTVERVTIGVFSGTLVSAVLFMFYLIFTSSSFLGWFFLSFMAGGALIGYKPEWITQFWKQKEYRE